MKMRLLMVMVPALTLGFAGAAFAAGSSGNAGNANVAKLIQAHGCSSCHAAKSKIIGPAWDWVAWRYKGKSKRTSANEVAKFIVSGGVGYWKKWTGGIPMPAHPDLKGKKAHAIAKWVLAHPAVKPPKAGG
ncbi:MAG: c-type cytochrome [Gammaproteobacteria bacterium]